MARLGRRAARTAFIRHACLLAAVAVSVAGCVGMAQTGQVGTFGNKQVDTAQNQGSDVGLFPSGPVPGSSQQGIVQQFLAASASYPADVPIIQEYLAGSARDWNPGSSVTVLDTNYAVVFLGVRRTGRHGGEQALVEVSGRVQAASNSSGQYVSASVQGGKLVQYKFSLVKVDNQWRITNPPPAYRLITAFDFSPQDYQAQDLYFFPASDNPSLGQGQMLVPDSVFVSRGTLPTLLLRNLVSALAQGPGTTWLQGAAISHFPAGTKILDVVQDGATVTVNLGGTAVSAKPGTLADISAQLLWTLAGPSASVPTVQSVELELDGKPWSPPSPPCPNGPAPTAYQGLASYECYDPYPSVPASFSYVGQGQPWSRCGSESVAQDGNIGSVESVFGRTGSADSHQCGGYVDPGSPAQFPRAVQTATLSMVAVSPGGSYVAGVSPSPDRNTLYVGSVSGPVASFSAAERLKNEPSSITAISWDHDSDLWAAQGANIWVVPGSGTGHYPASNSFGGQVVTGLAVAPDSVRIAAIVQDGAGSEIELAPVYRGVASGEGVQRGSPVPQFTIGPGIQLGPNLTDPVSLTWYNADTLIVLDGNTLWSVPVDGEAASQLPVTPSGVISITADGPGNILVVGQSDNHLEFAESTSGPWEDIEAGGSNPAYP